MLDDIEKVDVWLLKKSEKSVAWKLYSINVIRHNDHTLFRFPYFNWLGKETMVNENDHASIKVEGEPLQILTEVDFRF